MEHTTSRPPKRITDSIETVCSKCKNVNYRELTITEYDEEGSVSYTRIVTGSYKQSCDSEGVPNGPVLPFCNCED